MVSIRIKSEERGNYDEEMIMIVEEKEIKRKSERKIKIKNLTELVVYSVLVR